MNRSHATPTLPLMLMASAALWTAHSAMPGNTVSAQSINASYAVTFSVKAPTTLQSGSTVTCRARVEPKGVVPDKAIEAAPMVQGSATLSGLAAQCSVVVPFTVVDGDLHDGAALSYEIDASSGSTLEAVRRQEGIWVPLPLEGQSKRVHLDVNF